MNVRISFVIFEEGISIAHLLVGEYITEFKRVLSSSLCKCMAPSKTSISMSLFLMSR